MRFPLPAINQGSSNDLPHARTMRRRKASLMAAGASVLVLGAVSPETAIAANVPGVSQVTIDTIAINLLELGEADPAAAFGADVTVSNPGGFALAEAFVLCADSATCADAGAVMQYARGTTSAANMANIGGELAVRADANADGASAIAAGIISNGLWQVAAAEQQARNDLIVEGSLTIGASANAIATNGSALAIAAVSAGISQVVTSIGGNGTADNAIDNQGEITIAAIADASAVNGDAQAGAFVDLGIMQRASGQQSASVELNNSGDIGIVAAASADAPDGIATAVATAIGVIQLANARTQQFSSGFTDGGNLVAVATDAPSGPATVDLVNSGTIAVQAAAVANGGVDASATAAVLGVGQAVSGSTAEAAIDNSGTIAVLASVDAVGGGSPRGVVFVSGITQSATAAEFGMVETIDPNGVLTLELSSTPSGPAIVSLTNSGDIAIGGEVNVAALGTTSMAEGLGVAFVDGLDQTAWGDGAEATIDNSGTFQVSAEVSVDSGNISNAVAIATGIDQYASAYATHATIVFANGTTTPTTFTAAATAVGSAVASLDNSGTIAVLASVESHGDEIAFGGATASAIGQFAAGTDAQVVLTNSGTIASVGKLSSSGNLAFGGAAAIGFQQGAEATSTAEAMLTNSGDFLVMASIEAQGNIGAFANATVFGGAQIVQSEGLATASIANEGNMDIRAIVSAVAGDTSTFDMAIGFATAHGFGQLAGGQQAVVEFDNSGTLQLLAAIEASAGEYALASAVASGAIQQVALGSASGTGSAIIENSGDILVGAMADVAAGSTALALAGIQSAMVQAAFGGQAASASIVNSGTITLAANAEALAAGGDITDVASAIAYAFGLNALASATGASGQASVDLTNHGTIDVIGVAHATASGFARAAASAAQGMVGNAVSADAGPVDVTLTNDGELSLIAMAQGTGGYTAHGSAVVAHGMVATAIGQGDATALIVNSGDLTLVGNAEAVAGTNALAIGIAVGALKTTARGGNGDALASISNSGDVSLVANASASALNAQAFAIAGGTFGSGAIFQSANSYGGDASAVADNSGSVSVIANALANGDVVASASAVGGPGFNQFAFATGGDALASFENTGTMEFVAHAEANGANSVFADAIFYNAVGQFANANGGTGQAIAQMTNDGSISVGVVAEGHGVTWGEALAIGNRAVVQGALTIGNDAIGYLENAGSIEVDVVALAEGSVAEATAVLQTGIVQEVASIGGGEGYAEMVNDGTIDLNVVASADSLDGHGHAEVELAGAIVQYAGAGSSQYTFGTTGGLTQITQEIYPTGPATAVFDNSGSIDLTAVAIGNGGTMAIAELTGVAIDQFARGSDALASFDNGGTVDIHVAAMAEGAGDAIAAASLIGMVQKAAALETTVHITATTNWGQVSDSVVTPVGTGVVSFTNSGTFEVAGLASATGGSGSALAEMTVQGLVQSVAALDASAHFANDGEFLVLAQAEAAANAAATAMAHATGYAVSGSFDYAVDIANDGEFTVVADAAAESATGIAVANAVGMAVAGTGLLSGDIANGGDLMVRANAEGGSAVAHATGIQIGTNADGLNVTNTGVLAVYAATNGGDGKATGIGVVDHGSGGPGDVTVTNDGGVIVSRVSSDGGTNWTRGTAVDLSQASANSVLNLVGDGGISGNIDLASGQAINVTGGETWFNGIVNAECAFGACGQGSLNIGGGGALFLRHASADGPSAAYLEELNIASDGTIIFELPTGADPESAYPQIVTDVANLDGTLLVRSASGLYGDSYLFEDVIDAGVRNGQFDRCGIDGDPALLSLSCVYDAGGNVDLKLERIAFDAVDGLTRNQRSVGSGIEAVYDLDLDGAFGDLVEQLFTFDADGYREALSQLSGSGHAAYLQSFHNMGVEQNDLIDRAVGCELPGQQVSSLSCRTDQVSLWGQLDFANRRNDGDEEAGAYDADRWMAAIGVDARVGEDLVAGLSLTKVSNRLDGHDGSRWKADGYQLGAYGVFDRGTFYAKAMASMGWFNGDSQRRIDWSDLGGDLAGTLTGKPDARLWTLGARFGYRVALGERSQLTPYLNVDHSHTTLKGFAETGLDAAALAVEKSTSSRTAITAGAKWAADVGGVVPQVELGYRYRLGDRRAAFDTSFADQPGSDFTVVSAEEKRGSLLAGASLGGKVGKLDVRVGYTGLFDGQSTSHNASFRITLPLGK